MPTAPPQRQCSDALRNHDKRLELCEHCRTHISHLGSTISRKKLKQHVTTTHSYANRAAASAVRVCAASGA